MRIVQTLINLTILLTLTACGTFNVGDSAIQGAKEEKAKDKPSEEDESQEEISVTTTTTTTISNGKVHRSDGSPEIIARYELLNDNRANTTFVGANYCEGSELHDCWIRSGYLTEYDDGSYTASIEFWDTAKPEPYTVKEEKIGADEERAVLLTDSAKSVDDESVSYKMLWAVIVPSEKGVAVIYDWAGDGPNPQGDDMLDALQFYLIEDTDD